MATASKASAGKTRTTAKPSAAAKPKEIAKPKGAAKPKAAATPKTPDKSKAAASPKAAMPEAPKVKGPASYFPSIEKTYGKPVSVWLDVLAAAGERKHMELVTLLKTEHGLGHGHANALVAHFVASN